MQAILQFRWLLIAAALASQSAPASQPAAAQPADSTKSVFINDPAFGRDPFFPKSTRRPVVKPKVETPETLQQPQFAESIQLKGVSLASGRKLALLNYYTFAEGEEADLRVAGQVVRVRCLEIKERSVVVSIKGLKKELQLRQGL